MRVLITGCAGFIGFHVEKKFLEKNFYVYGTFSNSKKIENFTKIKNKIEIKEGLIEFINWCRNYFKI